MGDKMKEKADTERFKIEKQNGNIRQFLNQMKKNSDNNGNNTEAMQLLLSNLIQLIEQRLPLSDDLLLLCFRWELQSSFVFFFFCFFSFCLAFVCTLAIFWLYICWRVLLVFCLTLNVMMLLQAFKYERFFVGLWFLLVQYQ